MKRFLSMILVIIILIQPVPIQASGFTDISRTDWYYDNITKLVDMGGFSGYPDGSIRPQQTMTRAEFIKSTLSLLGYEDLTPTGTHWASGYVAKALKLNLICPDMTTNLNSYITRYDMARISSHVLTYQNQEPDKNLLAYIQNISDINKIPATTGEDLKVAVLHSFANGVITGYPDGTFSGTKTLTRAEAASVLLRLTDKSLRVIPSVVEYTSDYAIKVLELVNIERAKEGLSPLVMDSRLQQVATEKSKDMAISDYFSHTSPNYGSPFDMMKKFGVSYMAAGENIAMGYRTPEEVMDGWMNSPGHKANILSSKYGKIGIGVYFGDSVYWTQMFTN
jgi:uncharacterized YkwD family protein